METIYVKYYEDTRFSFFSLVATLLLFSVMKSLITNNTFNIPEKTEPETTTIVMPKQIITTFKTIERDELQQPIIHPPLTPLKPLDPGKVFTPVVYKPIIPITSDNPTPVNIINTAMYPWIRTEPQYPPVAAQRGLEGWCIVQFTVTELGTVENPVVIESSNRLFEKSSLKTVKRWKYKPKVMDGAAIAVDGVETKLVFKLKQSI